MHAKQDFVDLFVASTVTRQMIDVRLMYFLSNDVWCHLENFQIILLVYQFFRHNPKLKIECKRYLRTE
jgi:hypothetical protein